jgi:antitoxin component YwqK of YwqJK toxin-antitoxin module
LTKELALATPSGTLSFFSPFESPNLSFYEDGSIQYGMLAKNSPVQTPLGIVMAHGGDTNNSLSLSWYPHGNLKSILPAEAVTLKGRHFAIDQMIDFNEDGSLNNGAE